jgi:hypothetical protein
VIRRTHSTTSTAAYQGGVTEKVGTGTAEAAPVIAKAQVDALQTGTDRVVSTLLASNLQREQTNRAIDEVSRTLDQLPASFANLIQPGNI